MECPQLRQLKRQITCYQYVQWLRQFHFSKKNNSRMCCLPYSFPIKLQRVLVVNQGFVRLSYKHTLEWEYGLLAWRKCKLSESRIFGEKKFTPQIIQNFRSQKTIWVCRSQFSKVGNWQCRRAYMKSANPMYGLFKAVISLGKCLVNTGSRCN